LTHRVYDHERQELIGLIDPLGGDGVAARVEGVHVQAGQTGQKTQAHQDGPLDPEGILGPAIFIGFIMYVLFIKSIPHHLLSSVSKILGH